MLFISVVGISEICEIDADKDIQISETLQLKTLELFSHLFSLSVCQYALWEDITYHFVVCMRDYGCLNLSLLSSTRSILCTLLLECIQSDPFKVYLELLLESLCGCAQDSNRIHLFSYLVACCQSIETQLSWTSLLYFTSSSETKLLTLLVTLVTLLHQNSKGLLYL